MIAVQGSVTGRVQGVGFRFFARERALALELAGFVQNMPDGSVAFFAQGSRSAIEQFCQRLCEGPRFSRVDQCDYAWVEPEEAMQDFSIRY